MPDLSPRILIAADQPDVLVHFMKPGVILTISGVAIGLIAAVLTVVAMFTCIYPPAGRRRSIRWLCRVMNSRKISL